jgi:hypothetical protein
LHDASGFEISTDEKEEGHASLFGLQRRPEVSQRTDWARGLPFKLRDIPCECRLEFHRKRSIFFAMRVQLDQSQGQPGVFKQLKCRTAAHDRIIALARNGLLIVHNPSRLCFDERKATQQELFRP